MGFAKGLKKLAEKTVPGGDWTPTGAIHRGINKGLGIDEGFMQPNFLSQRIEANRSGDSQWQKINPKNLRDYNEKMGYNYKEGGRDPKEVKVGVTAPTGGTQAPPQMRMPSAMANPMQGARQVFTPGGNPMAKQMAQVQGLRQPPNPIQGRF
jgi:hypothetical protein